MTYDALRKGRLSLPGHAYLVTTVAHGRVPCFADFGLARLVVGEMRRMAEAGALSSIAWVLMPDHLHWLFQLGDRLDLAAVVKTFKGCSARAVNRHSRRRGPLWQRAYHDRAIRGGEDIRQAARYIVANPLRAGLVADIGDYPLWDAVWL